MDVISEPRFLILETSGRVGHVAIAEGERLLAVRPLDEARRHARDLAPAVRDLLTTHGWRPRDLHGVIVSRGPGSYTGLRVGLMSAKTFAYATGCALLGVDTFAAIAHQAPAETLYVDVIGDAQQDKVYVQRFSRASAADPFQGLTPLGIRTFVDWLAALNASIWVSGPGLEGQESRLHPGQPVVAAGARQPSAESLLHLGLARYRSGEGDDFWTVEPLYLRPSSAEEKWNARK
jgi:tRNA threonylcarbamoyladenosine biosynthesis protein TsaB